MELMPSDFIQLANEPDAPLQMHVSVCNAFTMRYIRGVVLEACKITQCILIEDDSSGAIKWIMPHPQMEILIG